MTRPVLIPMPGNERAAAVLAQALSVEIASPQIRSFPDGETYVRLNTDLDGRQVALVCALDRPDTKLLPLRFAARLAKELRGARVGLVAPYLAYMRQDRRFHPGEAVTSDYFAELLSETVDWLVTVDPHLHRRGSLAEIYSIPTRSVGSAPLISSWIREHVARPLLIGPDAESEQWVGSVAAGADVPYIVLEKERHGDRSVRVSVPDVEAWRGRTPVLIDDIVSTGRTMIETVKHLRGSGMAAPICLAVHAVFAAGAYDELRDAGAVEIVTCNTIAHESNRIDVTPLLADGVREMLGPI